MRPETANRVVNDAFERTEYKKLDLSKFMRPDVRRALSTLLEKRMRNGEESHTYYQSSIGVDSRTLSELHYIWGKWQCVGRIKFLLAVIQYYSRCGD